MTDGSFTPYEHDTREKKAMVNPLEENWASKELRRLRMENMNAGIYDEPLPVTLVKIRQNFKEIFLADRMAANAKAMKAAETQFKILCEQRDKRILEAREAAEETLKRHVAMVEELRRERIHDAQISYQARVKEAQVHNAKEEHNKHQHDNKKE
eukprot:9179214-Pyramimonas_sp.AAC.1